MTRSKTKALKEALNALVLNVSTKSELKGPLEYQEETLVHLIHVLEGPIQPYLGPEVRTSKETRESYYHLETTCDANIVITWQRNPHAKTSIPENPSKSGLIGV